MLGAGRTEINKRYTPWFNKLMVQQRGPTDHINGKHSPPSPPHLLYLVFWVKVHNSKGTGVPSGIFLKWTWPRKWTVGWKSTFKLTNTHFSEFQIGQTLQHPFSGCLLWDPSECLPGPTLSHLGVSWVNRPTLAFLIRHFSGSVQTLSIKSMHRK